MSSIITNLAVRPDGSACLAWHDDPTKVYGFEKRNDPNYGGWQKPWGGNTGIATPNAMRFREAMALSGIDRPVTVEPMNVNGVTVPGMRAVCVDGVPVACVSRSYPVIPHVRKLAGLLGAEFDDNGNIVGDGPVAIEQAALLGNGEQAYAVVKVRESRVANGGGIIRTNLLAHVGWDGRTISSTNETAVNVVCQNTLRMAFNDATYASSNLRTKVKNKGRVARVEERHRAIGEAMRDALVHAEMLDARLNALDARTMSDDEMRATLARIFGKPNEDGLIEMSTRSDNRATGIIELVNRKDGTSLDNRPTGVTGRHTAYDLLQAFTFDLDQSIGTTDTESRYLVERPDGTTVDERDAGERYSGANDEMLARLYTDSAMAYRESLDNALSLVLDGADMLAGVAL